MPEELHVIKAGDFLHWGGEGTIDFETSRRVLQSMAETLVGRGIHKAILDLRKVYGNPPATYTQLYHLAKAFQDAGFGPQHRLAIMITPDRHDKAEFFAICASGRGWNTWPFDEFEEAFDWLTDRIAVEPPAGG